MRKRACQGLTVVLGLMICGCQADVTADQNARNAQEKQRVAIAKKPNASVQKSPVPEPIYIDLGPIETANFTTAPVETITLAPVPIETVSLVTVPIETASRAVIVQLLVEPSVAKFDRSISPTEAIKAEQLRPGLVGGSDLVVEQPSGTLRDRCDPEYWGGVVPPGNLRCGALGQNEPVSEDHQSLRPGTYVRLSPAPGLIVQDADSVVRRVGEHEKNVGNDAFGAVLILEEGRAKQPTLIEALEQTDPESAAETLNASGQLP